MTASCCIAMERTDPKNLPLSLLTQGAPVRSSPIAVLLPVPVVPIMFGLIGQRNQTSDQRDLARPARMGLLGSIVDDDRSPFHRIRVLAARQSDSG